MILKLFHKNRENTTAVFRVYKIPYNLRYNPLTITSQISLKRKMLVKNTSVMIRV